LTKGDITQLTSIPSLMSCHVKAAILIQLEITPFDLPTQKTLP